MRLAERKRDRETENWRVCAYGCEGKGWGGGGWTYCFVVLTAWKATGTRKNSPAKCDNDFKNATRAVNSSVVVFEITGACVPSVR